MVSADNPCCHTAKQNKKNQRYDGNHGRGPKGIPEVKVGIVDDRVQILK